MLEDEVKAGAFREDLFYRLKVVKIRIPPLRERKEDIPVLVRYLIHNSSIKNKDIDGISNDAMSALAQYDWPGNIRELENVIQHAIVMSKGSMLSIDDLPPEVTKRKVVRRGIYSKKLKDVEREHILNVLDENENSRRKAADVLGISLRTLQYKLKEYNVFKTNK